MRTENNQNNRFSKTLESKIFWDWLQSPEGRICSVVSDKEKYVPSLMNSIKENKLEHSISGLSENYRNLIMDTLKVVAKNEPENFDEGLKLVLRGFWDYNLVCQEVKSISENNPHSMKKTYKTEKNPNLFLKEGDFGIISRSFPNYYERYLDVLNKYSSLRGPNCGLALEFTKVKSKKNFKKLVKTFEEDKFFDSLKKLKGANDKFPQEVLNKFVKMYSKTSKGMNNVADTISNPNFSKVLTYTQNFVDEEDKSLLYKDWSEYGELGYKREGYFYHEPRPNWNLTNKVRDGILNISRYHEKGEMNNYMQNFLEKSPPKIKEDLKKIYGNCKKQKRLFLLK